jgi:hypothetical protein
MLARRNLGGIDAMSIAVMGSDGHAYVIRRMHGSFKVRLSEFEKWAEKRIWRFEDVPGMAEGAIRSLNEAYERYLQAKAQDLELTAHQWLVTADRLAGTVSDLLERGYRMPQVVTVYVEKHRAIEIRKRRKKRTASRPKLRPESAQMSLFGG